MKLPLVFGRKKWTIILIACLAITSLWVIPGPQATGAELVVNPASLLNQAGQTWSADISTNSNIEVNSVDATISYDPELVEVLDIQTDQADFDMTVFKPIHDQDKHTVQFLQTSLQPHQGLARVGTITFRGIRQGNMNLTVSNVTIVAHDGQGTNVYRPTLNQSLGSWLFNMVRSSP